MTGNKRDDVKTIDSVHTSFRILEALMRLDGAGVTELAREVGTTKATVYNHLATLNREEVVVKDDGQYHLGLRFLDLAHHAQSRIEISSIVEPEIDKLARCSDELALFAVEEFGKTVCLYYARGENSVQSDVYVGNRLELHYTAVGKAILAHVPEERRTALVEGDLTKRTGQTITDPAELRCELDEIREQGVAFNLEETIDGLVGVGAPIVLPDGSVAGGISVIGPETRISRDQLEGELAEFVTRSANIIEIDSRGL